MRKAIFKKLEELIESKMITKNEVISVNGLASMIQNAIREGRRKKEEDEKMVQALDVLSQREPELYDQWINQVNKNKDQ